MYKENERVYVYTINFNNIPIYVGSTSNIKQREKSHCSNLCNEYKIELPVAWQKKEPRKIYNINQNIYRFLKNNNISKIDLSIILEFDNKIIVSDKIDNYNDYIGTDIPLNIIPRVNNKLEVELYHSNELKYIEEERIINHCFNKGLKLFNLVYPTVNKLGQHNRIEVENIKIL